MEPINEKPINFEQIAEAFEVALRDHEDIPDNVAGEIIETVKEACHNNEEELVWNTDYRTFMDALEPLLNVLYDNGYRTEVENIDELRKAF